MWIAREKSGELLLYAERPIHNFHTYKNTYDPNYINARGFCCGLYIGELDSSLFPEVTFDNSPVEVELKLKLKNEMNHDLIHCDGVQCPLREICQRYMAHLDLKENQYNGLYDYYVIRHYDEKTKSCKQFKKIE